MNFDDRVFFFENLSRKFKFHYNRTRITGTLHEDLCTFVIKSCSVLLGMRNVSEKVCRKFETHFMFNSVLFENRTRITGTLHDDLCTFMIISCSVLLRMRNVSEKVCRKFKTHILCSIAFFSKIVPFGR